MGNLIAYSGISTKIKAMERWRIRESQFEAMSGLQTVSEAVQFLKQFPPYASLFTGAEEGELHRGDIEQRLNQSQYSDFAKLYRFASVMIFSGVFSHRSSWRENATVGTVRIMEITTVKSSESAT